VSKSFSVFVSIGAKLLPSINTSIGAVDKAFARMNRNLRVGAIETRTAMKGIADSMKPIAAMAAAGGLSFGFASAIGNSAKLAHEVQNLRNIGLSTSDVASAFVAANRTMAALPTTTILDNVRALREGVGAFGDFHHALENLTFNQRLGSMLKNSLGSEFDASHAIASGIRALEIRGTAMDPKRYQAEMGELFRSMTFFGGRFSPDELAAFAGTGNIPVKGYNLRFLSRILPSLIQEQGGGDIVGTQAAAFRNQILGRVPLGGKKLTAEWIRLGLVPPAGTGGNLSRTGWTPGSVKNSALAMSDPFAWIETTLLPAMQRGGVNTSDPNAVLTQVSKMFGRETAVRFVSTMADPRQRNRLHRDEANIGRVQSVGAAYAQSLRNDPLMAWGALKSSLTNLSSVLFGTGKGESPVAVALVKVATGINSIAATIEQHPRLGQAIGGLLGFSAGWASLRVAGIGLGFLLKPLAGLFRLFTGAGGLVLGLLPRLGNVLLAFVRTGLGRALVGGLIRLGPLLLEGIAAAFAFLSNPVGWALLAVAAVGLIWHFRKSIAAAWHLVLDWFATSAWPAITGTFAAVRSWGANIVSNIIAGIQAQWGRLTGWFAARWASLAPTWAGGAPVAPAMPAPQGKRALGGPVHGGRPYLVGERGAEIFMPSVPGRIIPHGAGLGAGGDVHATFNIYDATNPQAVARQVEAYLARLARRQDAALHD